MASAIQQYLTNILNAVYGRDVRSSIHDAIEICYDDVTRAKTIADDAAANVSSVIDAANTATTNANNAAGTANSAANFANTAASSANVAASAANTAKTNADAATTAANTAKANADTATTNANDAADAANDAASAANTAKDNADTATANANSAATAANNAASAATTAAGNANTAATTATNAASNADTKASAANTAANTANTAATNADIATGKAEAATTAANTAATNANAAKDAANTAAADAITATTNANAATTNANQATSDANTAIATMTQKISDCETAISDAVAAKNNANTATTSANRAAGRADTAAEAIEDMTVTSEDAPPTTAASAAISDVEGHKNIHFVLRQGKQGAPFTIKGSAFATVADLQNGVQNPAVGDQYNVGDGVPYNVYRWTGSAWEDQGKIGSNTVEITNDEIDAIRNGRTVDPEHKALGVTGLGYLLNTVLTALLGNKVDKVSGKGLSTNDFTTAYKNTVDDLSSQVSTLSSNKVDKITGKGLSTNDFTTALKNKLDGIDEGANKITVDNGMSSTSTNPVQNKVIQVALNDKVDKVTGKSLTTNDFTDAYKTKLDGIAEGATAITVDTALSSTSTNPVQNKAVHTALAGKVDVVSGKGLSTNDFTTALKNKLDGIATGATKTTIDSVLSTTSTNPVQNKIVTEAINACGSLKFTNVNVATSAWTEESTPTYEDFPYKANVACANVTAAMFASVVFDVADAFSGNFAPVAESGAGIVSIWASEVPEAAITIPTIVAFK